MALVRERDLDSLRRGVRYYGLAPDLAISTAVLLPNEMHSENLHQLAEWTPESGPLGPRIPRQLVRHATGVLDWDALRRALRNTRRHACRRAFMQYPFQLGPAVAFLLLREEEVRGLIAFAEARGEAELDGLLNHVLAASMMGA